MRFLFFLFILFQQSYASDSLKFFSPSKKFSKDRYRALVFTATSGYVASVVALNELWYKDFQKEKFHFFNDNNEWLQVDKVGHLMTSYYLGKLGQDALKWTGSEKSYGNWLGLVFLSTIEMFDSHSSGWGFSYGDIIANFGGLVFLDAQEKMWKEQRMLLKFSFSQSGFATYRPGLLGKNYQQQMLKDYNGHTGWLSANIASFMKKETKFPKWLNVAVGYGATGMIGGMKNPLADKNGNLFPEFKRERQYYLSVDIDLTRLKTKSPFVNSFLNTFGFIKFPAPALELRGGKVIFHTLYF